METMILNEIDKYISDFPAEVQQKLELVRNVIKVEIPLAEEKISYGIPTFTLYKKNVVHFAAFKNHIGFYPTPAAGEEFVNELANYKTGKGSVQFPYDKEIPLDLIKKIVRFRVSEIKFKVKAS